MRISHIRNLGVIILSIVFTVSMASCVKKKETPQVTSKPILTGWLTEQQLFDTFPEYEKGNAEYQADSSAITYLKQFTQPVDIIVFLGTWCPDCRREVPRFLKTMALADNNRINYRLLGLDRTKRDSMGLAEKNKIEYVPTFVIFHNDDEIGRIVEIPMLSIEQDLVEILSKLDKRGRVEQ